MRVLLWIGLSLFTATPMVARAQYSANDAQRRSYVVPYVRRANDCLAGQLIAAPDLVEIARSNHLRSALAGPFRACADEINAMIAAHDRAWFPGAGEQFFQGPYLSDVPRAVQQRLQKEINRREQEATRVAAENAQREAAAEQQRAAEARAAALWAENDRKQAEAIRAQAARKTMPPETIRQSSSSNERTVASDPAAEIHKSGPSEISSKSENGWSAFLLLAGLIYCAFKFGVPALRSSFRRKALMAKYGDETIVSDIINHMIWTGMTAEQLRDSWGNPVDIGSGFKSGKRTATFKYGQTGKNRFARRAYLEDDIVVGWEQK